nr:unnamed protein product [Spirometra erinaceieuropaei]
MEHILDPVVRDCQTDGQHSPCSIEGIFSNTSLAEKDQRQLPPRYAWNDNYANPDAAFICSTPSWLPYSSSSSSSPPASSAPTVEVQHPQTTNFDDTQPSDGLFPLATVAASTVLVSDNLTTEHAAIHQLGSGQQDQQLSHNSYTGAYSGAKQPCHLPTGRPILNGAQASTPPHLPLAYSAGNYSEHLGGLHEPGTSSHCDWLPELKVGWQADGGGSSAGGRSPFNAGLEELPRLHNLTPLPTVDLEAHRSVDQPSYLSLDDDTDDLDTLTSPIAGSTKQWFSHLLDAWTNAWKDGVFPNPADVSLHLDLNSSPALRWRLTLGNIWADLLMRRVLAFVSNLFGIETDQASSSVISADSFYLRRNADEASLLSKETFLWICKNRLVNCVPVVLAKSIIQPLGCGLGAPKTWPAAHLTSSPATFETQVTPMKSPGPAKVESSESESDTHLPPAAVSQSQIDVCFQVLPKHRVFISLSKLSQRLSEVTTVSTTRTTSSAFPTLQYLDTYVYELHKFLAENPILLGSFMAIKLTQPPNSQEAPLCDTDLQQLQALNSRLVLVFCAAADHVGDGLPRRLQLPDFLDWGRQFDADMVAFLRDTCEQVREHVEVLEDAMTGFIISPGLATFCDVDENSSPSLTNNHNHLQQQLRQSQSSASSTPSLSGALETGVSEIENFT